MAAKRLVPLFGGSAAVWTTCLVFFQFALLLGYCLAHWLATRGPARHQGLIYAALLAAGMLLGPSANPHFQANLSHPMPSVFRLLTISIGLPFVALSASSPLLQAWYARSHSSGEILRPPYRLFALSNFGSLAALASYPAFIEPRFSLPAQTIVWRGGFALFFFLCVLIAWKARNSPAVSSNNPANENDRDMSLSVASVVPWLLLAACGSTLLCAVTSYLSQNIAAIPLLWIAPLTMYLLSFILAFQGASFYPRGFVLRLMATALGGLGYMLWVQKNNLPLLVNIPLFCGALLIFCLFCHGELYRLRPEPSQTTAFYLCIAAGGALGALFVGILAPLIFSADYEFCCALIFTAAMALVVTWRESIAWRVLWFAGTLAMAAVFVVYARNYSQDSVVRDRNFYGILRVTNSINDDGSHSRILYNGTIEHGTQLDGADRTIPTTYYSQDSGVGLALNFCCTGRSRRVGIIGLGAGTLAAYGHQGDFFHFYEINPLVEHIARTLFTYLGDSKATIEIALGDARLSLSSEEPQHFDVLVVDAFSGDAIPVHLLTTQALALYLRHLQPDGVIAFHVSNRYLDLEPLVRQQAEHAGLHALWISTEDDDSRGEYGSEWVLVSGNEGLLSRPELQEDAADIDAIPNLRLWTDDYNSLLPLLRWRFHSDSDESQ